MTTVAKAKAAVKAGPDPKAELTALLKAMTPIVWIRTTEEHRVEQEINSVATGLAVKLGGNGATKAFETIFWDAAFGGRGWDGKEVDGVEQKEEMGLFALVRERIWTAYMKRPVVWVLRDAEKLLALEKLAGRALLTVARRLVRCTDPLERQMIVVVSSAPVPAELQHAARALEWPLPDRATIENMIGKTARSINMELAPAELEGLVAASAGLGAHEIEQALAVSQAWTGGKFDADRISREKRAAVERSGALTWYEPDPRGLDAIGGLGELKRWLLARRAALSPEARAYGLPAPKGLLIVGPAGTGKSLTAKCVGAAWGVPVLRLDPGAAKSKWVGESEERIREALKLAAAAAPVILWVDEIEKSLGGSSEGAHQVDRDALGTILTWMSEERNSGPVFVVATCNQVETLPPELLRKGRFDEIFFVDLPTAEERAEIFAASLRGLPVPRDPRKFDLVTMARDTKFNDFSGAELDAAVRSGLYVAFAAGRELTAEDIVAEAEKTVPLARTRPEAIDRLRTWAANRARKAALPPREVAVSSERVFDAGVVSVEDSAETGA